MSNNIYKTPFIYYIIYKTTCLVNHKIYIGCHATNNLDDGYLGSGKWLKRSIKKYRRENFKREILFIYSNPADMFQKETELVTESFVASSNTYNLVVGGFGGFKILNVIEWKEKLKLASNARENKTPMLGKTHSDQTKQRMSDANKGQKAWNKGLPGTWIGKSHTVGTKEKISKNRKGLTAGTKNPMFGKSAVAGRKWYNDGINTFYLFPDNLVTKSLMLGRLKKPNA